MDETQIEYENPYKQPNFIRNVDMYVTLPLGWSLDYNEDSIKDFTIVDDIYTPGQGIIGSVIAKHLTANLFKKAPYYYAPDYIYQPDALEGAEVYFLVGLGETKRFDLGAEFYNTFIIQKSESEQVKDMISIEAFDYMIKFNVPYKDTLTYPCQVKDILNAICEQCDVLLGTETFANQDFEVESNPFVNGESCRDVLKAIAQISGTYARIGRNDRLYLQFPNRVNVQTFDETDYMPDIKINNTFGPVNRLVLKMSQVEGENVVVQDDEAIERDGIKELVIADNPFTYTQEKREKAINAIWEVVKGFTYTDYEMKIIPRLRMDPGDAILIKSTDGTAYYSYIFTHEIRYSGGINASISATADTEIETKYAFIPAISNRLKHTELVVDKANQAITAIVEEQADINSTLTQLQLNIQSINADVKTIGGNNKQENSVGAFGTEEYEQSQTGDILAYETSELKSTTVSGRAIMISNGKWFKFKSTNLIIGETYTLSFKYSNEELNHCKISLINIAETTLVDTYEQTLLTDFEYTFVALSNFVELYVSAGNYSMIITDYYLQNGNAASVWQSAPGEIQGTSVSIYYNGIKVSSDNSEIITKINNLGFSVENKDGKVLITVNKDEAILNDTNVIGVLRQSHWKRRIINIDNKEVLIEVHEV